MDGQLIEPLAMFRQSIEAKIPKHIVEIDPMLVDPSPYQPRSVIEEEGIRDLATAIKAQGQLEPVIVRIKEDGRYEVLSGHRRTLACRQVGVLLQARTATADLTENEALVLAAMGNSGHEPLAPLDEARTAQNLLTLGNGIDSIAEVFARTAAWVRKRLKLLELDPRVQDALKRGHIPLRVAEELHRYPKLTQRTRIGELNGPIDRGATNRALELIRKRSAAVGIAPRVRQRVVSRENALDGVRKALGIIEERIKRIQELHKQHLIGLSDAEDKRVDRIIRKLERLRR